jgi:hypothetical protein
MKMVAEENSGTPKKKVWRHIKEIAPASCGNQLQTSHLDKR